jgi:plasmid stabilization system protein ParE
VAQLRYAAAARDDLVGIAVYIARESGHPGTARSFTQFLRQRCADLAASSFQLGRLRPELGADIRSFGVSHYVIFFRYVGDILEVINILEGHRDIDAFFKDR